jgi:peptide/nickel transport system substrate-binding protein
MWPARSSITTEGGTCWQPQLKGLILMVNSIFNGNRFEDIWLDR